MFKRKTEILSSKTSNLDSTRTANSYLGKKVYSKSGNKLGRIKNVIIKNSTIIGFLISGFKRTFVDKEYVDSESDTSVMLSIDPVTKLVGKRVFDAFGKKVGKVYALVRKSNANNYDSLLVKKNIFLKPFTINKQDIDVSKENIILNKKY